MELPRFQSRSVTTPSSISPVQAGAGAAALSEAFAKGFDVTSQVTGMIGRANAEATAEKELANVRVRVRDFLARPEWERGDVDGKPVDEALAEAWEKEKESIGSISPDIQDIRARTTFDTRKTLLLSDADTSIAGQVRKVQVDRARAGFAAAFTANARGGTWEDVEQTALKAQESGALTAAETLVAKQQAARVKADALIDTDPDKVLRAFEDGSLPEINNLSGPDSNIVRERAQQEIRWREAEAARLKAQREAEARAYQSEVKSWATAIMGDAMDAFALGFPLPAGYAQASAALQSLPLDPTVKGLLEKDAALRELNKAGVLAMNPKELDGYLTGLENTLRQGNPSPAALTMLSTGRKLQADRQRKMEDDPVSYGIQAGIVPLPQADPLSMEGMVEAATRSRTLSARLGEPVTGYTSEALAAMNRAYTQMGADERMNFLGALSQSHGQDAALTLFSEMDKKGNTDMAFAGALALDSPDAARIVLQGQVALKENPNAKLVPDRNEFIADLNKELGGAYGFTGGARDDVIQAVEYAYAALAANANDFDGVYKPDRMTRAMRTVTGGIVEFNGVKMPAPRRGVDQRAFSGWVRDLNANDFASVAGVSSSMAYQRFLEDGYLVPAGPGKYEVHIAHPFLPDVLEGQDGNPLILEFDPSRRRTLMDVASDIVTDVGEGFTGQMMTPPQ
jgi:hypothetical protein